MQTIIQHVIRGFGPPNSEPNEIGIHYIDVQTGDLYISRGKVNIGDWGEPLKAAMVEGEEGKTFGWNNGQDWIVLNIGVQLEAVDAKDNTTANDVVGYVETALLQLGNLSTSDDAILQDGTTVNTLKVYTDSQLKLVSGVPGGGEPENVLAKLSNADRDAYWLTVSEGEVLQPVLDASIAEITSQSASSVATIKQVPLDGNSTDLATPSGWVDALPQLSPPQILYPPQGATVSYRLHVLCSDCEGVYDEVPRLYREFDVNGEVIKVDSDNVSLSLLPGTSYTLKCRDVTSIGSSEWSSVAFNTLTIAVDLDLDVERSIGSLVSANPKLTATVTTSGTIDSFTSIEWSVTDTQGATVWSLVEPFTTGTIQTTVPNGILEVGKSYTFKARVNHDLHGWIAQRSVVGTIAESVTRYLAFSSQKSYVYGQNVDSFDSTGITYSPPTNSSKVTTISSTGQYLAVGLGSSPYLVVYRRQGTTFVQIATGIVVTSEVQSVSFNSNDTHVVFGLVASPFMEVYTINNGTFTKLNDPATLPHDTVNACVYSPDNQHIALCHLNHPVVTVYKQNGSTLQKLNVTVPVGLGSSYGCSYNANGNMLALVTTYEPYLFAYKRSGDVYTQLTNPDVLPTGTVVGGCFSSDGMYQVVVSQSSPFVHIYKYSNYNMYNLLPSPSALPTGSGNDCAFSFGNTYLAVGHNASPYITIYKRNGDTFTKLANPASLPPGSVNGVSFKGDTHLAVAHNSSPYITIYKRSGDTFIKLANPSTLPSGTANSCRFSKGSSHLAVAHTGSPYITIYSQNGDVFTKLSNPSTLPTGIAYGCSFNDNGGYLAIAHATSPYVTVYQRSGDTFTKIANPTSLPPATCSGCCFESNFLALSTSGSPYRVIYALNTSTATLISLHSSTPTSFGGATNGVWNSPSFGTVCFGLTAINGSIRMLKRSSNAFSTITYPGDSPRSSANGCHFNPVTDHLMTVCNDSATRAQITVYRNTGTNLMRLENRNESGDVLGCRFSPDGKYVVVVIRANPYIRVYKWENELLTALPAVSPPITTPASMATVPSWYYMTGD